jgi:class 3 adenylate cyclase
MSNETNSADDAQPALQRRLATILSADVAGYSRMMGEHEEATVQTLRGHRAVFDALLKQHHGRVFNTAGDAILAEFPSAVEAVRCATEIQAALQTRNEHLPPELKMQFRMGINLGDVVIQEGDLLGDGVNVAARIQTVAEPGGICISGSVYDQIQNKLSLQFKPLGEQQFKNIGQPIRTFTITHGEGGALPASLRRPSASATRTVAIVAIAGAAVVAGGFWLYRASETKVSEQSALSAQLEAEKKVAEEARRTAEEQSRRATAAEAKAERERLVAEATKREAVLQAQLQTAEEARRRAEAERKRLDEDRQRTEAEKRTSDARAGEARAAEEKRAAEARAEAEKSQRVATATPSATGAKVAPGAGQAVAGSTTKFDGAYNGMMCNFPDNPARKYCWAVPVKLQNGAATATWRSRIAGKWASAQFTVGATGGVKVAVDGWNVKDGSPLASTLSGRATSAAIDVDGRWANGVRVDGHWARAP